MVVSHCALAGRASRAPACAASGAVVTASSTSPPTTERLVAAWIAISSAACWSKPPIGTTTLLPQPAINGSRNRSAAAQAVERRVIGCLLGGVQGKGPSVEGNPHATEDARGNPGTYADVTCGRSTGP